MCNYIILSQRILNGKMFTKSTIARVRRCSHKFVVETKDLKLEKFREDRNREERHLLNKIRKKRYPSLSLDPYDPV